MAANEKKKKAVDYSAAARSSCLFPPTLPLSLRSLAGGLLERQQVKADAKSSYEAPLLSLPALYLIDTCSLVNPGAPPGTVPHGPATNTDPAVTSHTSRWARPRSVPR